MTFREPVSTLPAPGPDERAHTAAVATHIRDRIADAGGVIPFSEYMRAALYAPGLGYYSAGSVKLGAGGDFVTAPEVSALFGRCVARSCAQVLEESPGAILELGAGTGALAAVLLPELEALGRLPQRYLILEVSADFAARQRERLSTLPQALASRVEWLQRLPAKPLDGVVVANEVLDALPCERFVWRDGAVRSLGVAVDASGRFVDCEHEPASELRAAVEAMRRGRPEPWPDGYVSEVCLEVAPWIASLGDSLARGALLLFDYGLPRAHYYHPQRATGTLRCHYRHRAHDDPCLYPGLQDITAWVDFTRVAEAAVDHQLEVAGFCTQAAFLLGGGLQDLLGESTDPLERARLAGEAQRLLLPGEMGEAFKVMALARGLHRPLPAFQLQDLRASL
jgi:SAM-dependent MidA family methyltransferase